MDTLSTKENLRRRAEIVRDETKDLANTAERVGQLLIDIVDSSTLEIIETNDPTVPTNKNVYSAARTDKEIKESEADADKKFLNKTIGTKQEVAGEVDFKSLIKALDGLNIGEFIRSMIAGQGAGCDKDGNMQVQSIEVRGFMRVMELIINRLNAQEGDTSFSGSGTIEKVVLEADGTYTLFIRKRWENDFTSFQEGDVVYGNINNLFSAGEYFTSWSRVLSKNITLNTISVIMYPDSEVPGGVNHAPEKLMVITHRGNPINEERQSYWYISTTERAMVWLEGVTKPILEENNYYMILGRPKNLSIFENLPLNYKHSAVYARTGIFQNIHRVNFQGIPIQELNDRGFWSAAVASSDSPYTTAQEMADTVWHFGCRWKCIISGILDEPKYAASGWAMIEGNPEFVIEIDSTKGWYFDFENFATTLFVVGKLYNREVTDHILDSDVSWTRNTGDISEDNAWAIKRADAGKNLPLTIDDLGPNYSKLTTCAFKATALLRDGQFFKIAEDRVTF